MKTPKLVYKNNWEADEYYVDDKRIVDLKEVEINGKTYKVESREVSVPYNDMGHNYTARSTHYFIKESVFGMKMSFDLNTIVGKQKVKPTKFTLRNNNAD